MYKTEYILLEEPSSLSFPSEIIGRIQKQNRINKTYHKDGFE